MLDLTNLQVAIKDLVQGVQDGQKDKLSQIAEIRESMAKDNDMLANLGKALVGASDVINDLVDRNNSVIELVATNDLADIDDFFPNLDEEDEVVEDEVEDEEVED